PVSGRFPGQGIESVFTGRRRRCVSSAATRIRWRSHRSGTAAAAPGNGAGPGPAAIGGRPGSDGAACPGLHWQAPRRNDVNCVGALPGRPDALRATAAGRSRRRGRAAGAPGCARHAAARGRRRAVPPGRRVAGWGNGAPKGPQDRGERAAGGAARVPGPGGPVRQDSWALNDNDVLTGFSMSDTEGRIPSAGAWQGMMDKVRGQVWPEACLYVVATPIGDLGDLTLRGWQALEQCDIIAAEDTRATRPFLQAWGIQTPLM